MRKPEATSFDLTIVREPGYSSNVGLARYLSHAQFCRNLTKELDQFGSADLIYSAYPLIRSTAISAAFASDRQIPLIVDIQDVWPEAILPSVPLLDSNLGHAILRRIRRRGERAIAQAAAIAAVSETYLLWANSFARLDQSSLNCTYLGVDDIHCFRHEDWQQQTIRKGPRANILYVGTLGGSYDLETLVRASAQLVNAEVRIAGAGPRRGQLEDLARKVKARVHFLGPLNRNEVRRELSQADIAVNPLRATAKQSVTNKIADYCAAGLPIVSSQIGDEIEALFREGGTVRYRAGDPGSLAKELQSLVDSPEQRVKHGVESRRVGLACFDRSTSYANLADFVREKVEG